MYKKVRKAKKRKDMIIKFKKIDRQNNNFLYIYEWVDYVPLFLVFC
jgi:hypothetical protein